MYSLKIKIARSDDSVGPSDTDPFEHKAWGPYVDQLRLYKNGKTHGGGHLVSWTPVGPLPGAPKGKPGVPTASFQKETEGRGCAARNVGAGGWCHVPECGHYLEDQGQGGPENLRWALSWWARDPLSGQTLVTSWEEEQLWTRHAQTGLPTSLLGTSCPRGGHQTHSERPRGSVGPARGSPR